jgi:hypothetical protein
VGMFDEAFTEVSCPGCGKKETVDIQFKVYDGDYTPSLNQFQLNKFPFFTYQDGKGIEHVVIIDDFPKDALKEEGIFAWSHICDYTQKKDNNFDYCTLLFRKGLLTKVIYPIKQGRL